MKLWILAQLFTTMTLSPATILYHYDTELAQSYTTTTQSPSTILYHYDTQFWCNPRSPWHCVLEQFCITTTLTPGTNLYHYDSETWHNSATLRPGTIPYHCDTESTKLSPGEILHHKFQHNPINIIMTLSPEKSLITVTLSTGTIPYHYETEWLLTNLDYHDINSRQASGTMTLTMP